jgi:hypothetical protein
MLKINDLDTLGVHTTNGISSHYSGTGIDLGLYLICSGTTNPDSECNRAQKILDQVGTKYGISCQVNYERSDYNRATHAHCSVSGY